MKQPNCIAVSTFPWRYAQHFIRSSAAFCGNVLQVCFGGDHVLSFLMWLLGLRAASVLVSLYLAQVPALLLQGCCHQLCNLGPLFSLSQSCRPRSWGQNTLFTCPRFTDPGASMEEGPGNREASAAWTPTTTVNGGPGTAEFIITRACQ